MQEELRVAKENEKIARATASRIKPRPGSGSESPSSSRVGSAKAEPTIEAIQFELPNLLPRGTMTSVAELVEASSSFFR